MRASRQGEVRSGLACGVGTQHGFRHGRAADLGYRNGWASLDVESVANDITDLVLIVCRPASSVTAEEAQQIEALARQIQSLASGQSSHGGGKP
jgi:hypothetical protein